MAPNDEIRAKLQRSLYNLEELYAYLSSFILVIGIPSIKVLTCVDWLQKRG